MTTDRRDFLKRAAITAATAASVGPLVQITPSVSAAAQARSAQPSPPARALDPVLLAAVGEAVLPESLGVDGRSRAIAAFARWIAQYQPVAEEMHGYGDAEITYTPPDPAPGWNAQLVALDLLARRKHRRAFARASVGLRRAVIGTQLGRAGGTRLPANPLAAAHVAVALMAHWAASSEAADLAYRARIVRNNCRPLGDTARKPLPLAGAEGA